MTGAEFLRRTGVSFGIIRASATCEPMLGRTVKADRGEVHNTQADGLPRIINGVDQSSLIPACAQSRKPHAGSRLRKCPPISAEVHSQRVLPVVRCRIFITSEGRRLTLRSRHQRRPRRHLPTDARRPVDLNALWRKRAKSTPDFEAAGNPRRPHPFPSPAPSISNPCWRSRGRGGAHQ